MTLSDAVQQVPIPASTDDGLGFNPVDPVFRANPYPVYKRLLEESPVLLTPFGIYAFARYDDCQAILRDHRRWSSDERKSPTYEIQRQAFEAMLGSDAELIGEEDRPFLFFDPPDHTRLRRLVNQAFTPRAIDALRPRIQQIVDSLLDAVAQRGEMELIADLAYPLPVIVICEMLGVPPEDQGSFRVWSAELARSLDPDITLPPEVMKRRIHAVKESREYFRGLVAERRKRPGNDILSALITAEEVGDKLSEYELLSTCTLLLIAGHETTVNCSGTRSSSYSSTPRSWQSSRLTNRWPAAPSKKCFATTRRCSSTDGWRWKTTRSAA